MSGMAMLLAGVIGGAVFASIVWAIVIAAKSGAQAKRKRAREELMGGVAELLAQADTLQASFRGGSVKRSDFAREMSKMVGAISSMVRVNMNNLDVFFVKYADQQVEEYMRLIENPERRRSATADQARDDGGAAADSSAWAVSQTDAADEDAADAAVDLPPPDAAIVPIGVDVEFSDTPTIDMDAFELPTAATAAKVEDQADDAEEEQQIDADDALADDEADETDEELGGGASDSDSAEELGGSAEDADDAGAARSGSWADKTDDEYAAEFEQFEEPAAGESDDIGEQAEEEAAEEDAAPAETPSETVVVSRTDDDADKAQSDAEEAVLEDEDDDVFDVFAAPAPSPVAARVPEDEDLELAETISFDRSTLADIVAAAGGGPIYARAPIPAAQGEEESAPAPAQPAAPSAAPPAAGITGEDVGNAIDNFFKLK